MKISLAITVLILGLFAAIDWHQRDGINSLRSDQQALMAEVEALGLAVYDPATGAIHRSSAPDLDREEVANALAEEFILVINAQPPPRQQNRDRIALEPIVALNERLVRLSADQLRSMLATLLQAPGLDHEARRMVIGLTILTLADSHPAAAAAVLLEAGNLLGIENHHAAREIIAKVFGAWAAQDPLAAVAWMKKNGTHRPELATDQAKEILLAGIAVNNPKLAFQVAGELGDRSHGFAIIEIVKTAQTPESQSAMLTLLRYQVKATGHEFGAEFHVLGQGIAKLGFDAASTWLPAAKLSPEECENLADGIGSARPTADTGRWLEFLGPRLPPAKLNEIVPLMAKWTTEDFRAAGDWLTATPNSATKQAAVIGYANAMARFKPAIAAQWAETLPADADGIREVLLRLIHEEWRRRDAAAAAAFASKHGLRP